MNPSRCINRFGTPHAPCNSPVGELGRQTLEAQNRQFKGTGGVSQENRSVGFVPAFLDTLTGTVYRSCFANGQLAPVHVLDGLPSELVTKKSISGRVVAVIDSVIAGFLREGRFYTRSEAANFVREH